MPPFSFNFLLLAFHNELLYYYYEFLSKELLMVYILSGIFIFFIAMDQLSKSLAVNMLGQVGAVQSFIPHFIRFEYRENAGMAWGLLPNARVYFIIVTLILAAFLVFLLVRYRKLLPKLSKVALTVILSGAIGNLIDRVALGYVRDFIAFDFMNFPVFNFADSCITVGAVLLIVSVLFTKSGRAYFAALDEKKQKPEKTDGEKTADCAAGNGGEAGAEPDVKQAESK